MSTLEDTCVELLLAARGHLRVDGTWPEPIARKHREAKVELVPYVFSVNEECTWGKARDFTARKAPTVVFRPDRMFVNMGVPEHLRIKTITPQNAVADRVENIEAFRFSQAQERHVKLDMPVLRPGKFVEIACAWSSLVPDRFERGYRYLLAFDFCGIAALPRRS